MTHHIRSITPEDSAIVSYLISALLCELRGQPFSPDTAPESTVQKLLRQQDRIFGYLLLESQRPIGIIMLSEGLALYAGGSYGIITELYIAPEARSSGSARQLLRQAEQLAQKRGWPMIEVGAPRQPKWQRSLNFYLNNGFDQLGPRLRKAISPND